MIDWILFGILFLEVISIFIIKLHEENEVIDEDIPPINDD